MKFNTIQEMIDAQRWGSEDPATGSRGNYAGENLSSYFVVVGQNRDSETLTRCNFTVTLEKLGGENEDKGVRVGRFGHWACGWYELILVHEDAPHEILEKAMEILNDIADYPILDEFEFSQMEHDEACETIENNMDIFKREVFEFLEFEHTDPNSLRPSRASELEIFVFEVYHEACYYSGPENAWVDSEAIQRVLESEYPNNPNNLFYKLCKAKIA